MDRTYTTDADIRDMVVEALGAGDGAEQFDVDGIVDDLKAAADYDGRQFVNIPEDDDFWAIVARHDVSEDHLERAKQIHAHLEEAEAEVSRIRAERDDEIRAAIADGTTMYAVSKTVGITEQSVARIRDRG